MAIIETMRRVRQWHVMALLGAGMVAALLWNHRWFAAAAMAWITVSGCRTLRMVDRSNAHSARMGQAGQDEP